VRTPQLKCDRLGCVAALVAVFVAAVMGCGNERPDRVPVSGQVLIDGQPLTHGYVRFAPVGSRQSSGQLDESGRFTLSCFEANDGAVPGTHRIAVRAEEPLGETSSRWYAPKKYANFGTSGLSQEITEPTDSILIELTWGNQKGPFIEQH
jgi:hypothetical protein